MGTVSSRPSLDLSGLTLLCHTGARRGIESRRWPSGRCIGLIGVHLGRALRRFVCWHIIVLVVAGRWGPVRLKRYSISTTIRLLISRVLLGEVMLKLIPCNEELKMSATKVLWHARPRLPCGTSRGVGLSSCVYARASNPGQNSQRLRPGSES